MQFALFFALQVALFALILANQVESNAQKSTIENREDEPSIKENSLNHSPTPLKSQDSLIKARSGSGLLNSLISDPTVPVFLVMGLASLASILTAVS